jgi:hypothetical protein
VQNEDPIGNENLLGADDVLLEARYLSNTVSCANGFKCQFDNAQQCLMNWLKTFSRKKEKLVTMAVAAMFRGIWKARNMVCFVNKWPLSL